MAAINVDGMYGANYSALTIDTAQVTVSKQFHTIAASGGTVGTVSNVLLDSGIGTQLNGSLTDVYLRPAAGHFIAFQHATGGTVPMYMTGSQNMNLNDQQTLHLVRNFGSNSWLADNGIALPGGVLMDLTSVQTATSKSFTSPNLTTPIVKGSLMHQGIIAGYSGAADAIAQVGTTVVGAVTGTAVSVSLAAEKSMKIKASVLAAKTDHTEALYAEVTGLFRRAAAGNIILVGTTTPVTIGTSALALALGVDTGSQVGNILITGVAGTSNFIVDYTYNQLGLA
jgi:hypothetical protein